MVGWHQRVLDDLRAIRHELPGLVRLIGKPRLSESSMHIRLRVCTSGMERVQDGLQLRDTEDFLVTVDSSEIVPPTVEVDHLRFLSHAHVLQGTRLCLYLDPSREWDPNGGIGSLLDRLFEWLKDAAAGRFDPETALFHAVGGVLHETQGAPSVVVRESIPFGALVQHGWLMQRAPLRYDLILSREIVENSTDALHVEHVPIIHLNAPLPLGAGSTLGSLLSVVDDPHAGHSSYGDSFSRVRSGTGHAAPLLVALAASAARKEVGSPQRLVIAVPHPSGGTPHLLVASLPSAAFDYVKTAVRDNRKKGSETKSDSVETGPGTELQWLPVSDERPEITTRRDSGRPVSAFLGKSVHIWGCGGLGSWVAEFIVRAGAKRVVLCDPSRISGGHLVRQNYLELDVGAAKADALAARLRAINDGVEVIPRVASFPEASDLADADVIIDATVSIAVGRLLDEAASAPVRPIFAQLACDVRTGTLGILSVSMSPETEGCLTLDQRAGRIVRADGALEPFHELWGSETEPHEIIPTRGCSTPTFHGSAADLTGIAASLVSLLGAHLGSGEPVSGTHLISLPHGENGPLRSFVPATHDGAEKTDGQAFRQRAEDLAAESSLEV